MKKILIIGMLMAGLLGAGICYAAYFNTKVPFPGSSVANAKLQYDTAMPVYSSVGSKLKGCQNMSVIDTKVTREPYNLKFSGNRAVGGQWEELWTVKACSKTFLVPVKFSLDPTGADYSIPVSEIKEK